MTQRDNTIIGKQFGRLTVLQFDYLNKSNRQSYWMCKCECGNLKSIRRDSITSTMTKSCGCLQIETTKKLKQKPFGDSTRTEAFGIFTRGAIGRGLKNELSYDEWYCLVQQNCHYCGTPPSTTQKSHFNNGDFTYNGLDRVDNNIGYIKSNIVTCCFTCNKMKGTLGFNEFVSQINKIQKNLTGTSSSSDWTILN